MIELLSGGKWCNVGDYVEVFCVGGALIVGTYGGNTSDFLIIGGLGEAKDPVRYLVSKSNVVYVSTQGKKPAGKK